MTTSSFPLFRDLDKELSPKDLTIKMHKQLQNWMTNDLSEREVEDVYMIIRVFTNEHDSKNSTCILPYGATRNDTNITFDLANFPSHLKKILYKFAFEIASRKT